MKRLILSVMLLGVSLYAQDLDALLERLKQENTQLSKSQQARESRFKQEKLQQENLLKAEKSRLADLKAESKKMQKRFDANEALIAEREKSLKERMGNLGELFGVVRQSAGDMSGIARASMVSAQLPERIAFLDTMAKSKRLPSSKDLEKLWLSMFEEMVESGKVTTFATDVVLSDGTSKRADVTRVGLFTAVSEGKYLRYDAQERKMIELPRQPSSRYMGYVDALENRHSGSVTAVIDPTRGTIFELMMEKPTLSERVKQGGLIGYIILGLGGLGLLIALVRLATLLVQNARVQQQLKALDNPADNNPLGRVLGIYKANISETIETIESRLDEAILKELPGITSGEALIKLLAAVAPLLGLLGTVVGMIETFQAITLFGTGDPKLMAGGISQALVTTMLGLIVAVPLLFAHSLVRSRSKVILEVLSQQSAGLIARRMERN